MQALKKFLVQLEKAYMDEVQTKSGIVLYRDTSFHPEFYAQTNGVVTRVPKFNDIDVTEGDQIYFSYQVIEDKIQRDRDTDIHKNLLFRKGKKVWMVAPEHIYFRVRDDQMEMLNGYVLLDFIEEETTSTLIVPDYLKKVKLIGQARVVAAKKHKRDDVIFFDKSYVETYELFGREYYILHETRILAKL
jgi:co-chaperonin GroES (HSP10)